MGKVINRGAADVHAHVLGVQGFELFLGPRQCIVDAQSHNSISRAVRPGIALLLLRVSGAVPAVFVLGANNYAANVNSILAAGVHGLLFAQKQPNRQAFTVLAS